MRMMKCDFRYENDGVFTKLQVQQIKKTSVAKIVCQNGDNIDKIQVHLIITILI